MIWELKEVCHQHKHKTNAKKRKKETKELQQTYDMRTQRDVPPAETQNKCKQKEKRQKGIATNLWYENSKRCATNRNAKQMKKKQRDCNKPMIWELEEVCHQPAEEESTNMVAEWPDKGWDDCFVTKSKKDHPGWQKLCGGTGSPRWKVGLGRKF